MLGKTLLVIAVALFLLVGSSNSQAQTMKERKIIVYGKRIDVSKIDPQLPKRRFSDWLKMITGPKAETKWEVNDCGEQTGTKIDKYRDLPFCLGVESRMADGRIVTIEIAVGTQAKGLTAGKFGIYNCMVDQKGQVISVRKLSELQNFLQKGP